MKNVLLLSASPRKEGNSDILCRQFEKGAKEAGHKTEMIRLYDKNIGFCRACYSCFKTGNNIKGIIWGERVWQKGEVLETAAMHKAYQIGLSV